MAEANEKKFTDEFLRYTLYTSLSENTKIFFGEKIPSVFVDLITSNSTKLIPFP